jgi:transposase
VEETAALIKDVPGVGPVTIQSIITELPELGRLTRRQIVALGALAPMNWDSGTYRGRRTISGGRSTLRATLYMAAFSAAQFNPTIKAFRQRPKAAGKPHQLIITACARKLLTILNAIIREKRPWQSP